MSSSIPNTTQHRQNAVPVTEEGVVTYSVAGVKAREYGHPFIHKTILTLKDVRITVTDTGGANGGYGALKIYQPPSGLILYKGSVVNLTSVVAATGIGATATVKFALGTAAEASNDTLDSTAADLVASTNVVLTGSAGSGANVSSGLLVKDLTNDASPGGIFLNIGVADAGITANSSVVLNGTVEFNWEHLGDK